MAVSEHYTAWLRDVNLSIATPCGPEVESDALAKGTARVLSYKQETMRKVYAFALRDINPPVRYSTNPKMGKCMSGVAQFVCLSVSVVPRQISIFFLANLTSDSVFRSFHFGDISGTYFISSFALPLTSERRAEG